MKAIKINPMDMQITEIDLPEMEDGSVDVEAIRAHLECKYFDVVRINSRGDGIFVDDEGLYRQGIQGVFRTTWYPEPIIGCGIVMGCSPSGDSIAPTITLRDVIENCEMGTAIPVN